MNNRDLELLSSYLDEQLSPNESARLESRVASDPELFSALADLRAARSILRKLPKRKAPRNFTLTRKMVGLNPPLSRSYSFFRFATAFASVLLVLTFAANLLAPRLKYIGPNTGWGGGSGGGYGGGGIGGGPVIQQSAPSVAEAPATESPAATEAPAMPAVAATEAPAATLARAATTAAEMMLLPTSTAAANQDTVREIPTAEAPAGKASITEQSPPQDQSQVENIALIPFGWQIAFLVIALSGAAVMFALHQSAKRKWH